MDIAETNDAWRPVSQANGKKCTRPSEYVPGKNAGRVSSGCTVVQLFCLLLI